MRKYKGFLLENGSSAHEIKEWSGGHSSEGTGRYETSYWTSVTDPKTLKSGIFQDEKTAICWIDNRKFNKEKNQRIDAKIEKLNKMAERLEERITLLSVRYSTLLSKAHDLSNLKEKELY